MWHAVFLLATAAHGAHAATTCTALAGATLTLDGAASTVSLTAIDMPAGQISENPQSPAYCSIAATVSSNANPAQSQIVIAVWLPETGWNGRFLGTGNGGFGGAIVTTSMKVGLLQGYATANTDMGTGNLFHCTPLFCGSREGLKQAGVPLGGLYGDPAAISDFGYGATHLMTLAGRELIQDYYGRPATYGYFHGCSTGGGQALAEAQLYPADYDGILAGSAAYDRSHLISGGADLYEVAHVAPDAYLTAGARAVAHAGMLAACAGDDGGLPTDGYLTQPAMCDFSPAPLQCTGAKTETPCTSPGAATACTCLTANQVVSMSQFWGGALDNANRVLDPGYERGAEAQPDISGFAARRKLTEPAHDSLDYWVFGPHFHWHSLFATVSEPASVLARRIRALDTAPVGADSFADTVNATHANLAAFNARGGKLLIYAGYEDATIPSADTIDYYNRAVFDDPKAPDYIKLFMAPGMFHCQDGPGANVFGNDTSTQPPDPASPADDIFAALTAWRESGTKPARIVATHYVNNDPGQGIRFQRPLCPYPQNAAYNGVGNPKQAENYTCAPGKQVENQKFSPRYGPQ